jgi:hypothetical protein
MLSRLTAPLEDDSFIVRFKRSAADFTRARVLTFRAATVLLMAKGSKSLQLSLNEFVPKLGRGQPTVSKVAYSKARRKLKHTAFIKLNEKAVVRTMYEDGDYQTFHGFRILAVDGSKVQLPTNKETAKEFGTFVYRSQRPQVDGEHSYALASVLYDVLNRVALDAVLQPAHSYEVELAKHHLTYVQPEDVVVYDRGYCSFQMLVLASMASGHFLVRCTSRSFKAANEMLQGQGPDDIVCEITANQKFLANAGNKGLPTTLTVRFVRVKLDTGEYEVLATSLLDQEHYPTALFKELYYLRWGIETFYGILKTRLNLENFSGLSPEAIRQDFHVAVLLTGVESILTEDAEEQLEKQPGDQRKKVNKAVSFNAIKYRAFELFYSKEPDEQRLEELTELFLASPTLLRKDRKPPREQRSSHCVLGWWKRQRKTVF